MIKRLNKVTSLLVAAAAVSSLVPATGVMAADYKRVESKDGTIYNAVAYKDGNFYIDGNLKDGETDGVYVLSNGKYTEIEDLDSGIDVDGIFGEKYLQIDGDNFLDLTTGKVTDEDIQSDAKDDVALALRKAIRNKADDRYDNHSDLVDTKDIEEISGLKFSETWYKTLAYEIDGESTTIYTDVKGNYIDADYNLGKIKVEVAENKDVTTIDSVTLTNTKDAKKSNDLDVEISAEVKEDKIIAQDANNIYRLATITLAAEEGKTVDFRTVNGVAVSGNTVTVLQKISKAQASEDVDGAKYAKSVTTYALKDGVEAILNSADGINAIGNTIVAYNENNGDITATTVEFETKQSNYTAKKGEETDLEDIRSYDVDAQGNLWVLKSGFVYKFNNDDDFEKVYKVDGGLTEMNVYDAENIVLWNEDDEIYSLISGKSASNEEDAEETVKAGWVQNADGTWCYFNADGSQVKGQWLQLGGVWYYIKADGIMATGWEKVNGTWYYLQSSGAMKTGWLNDNGTWYYLQSNGAMKTGWLNDNGTWYYLQSNGAMKTGWLHDTDGNWYYLQSNGAMAKNTTIDGYRLGSNGAWIR